MPAEAALRPRPNVAFRLSGPQCGGTDGPPTEKLLSFHGESFEICRGHPLRSRASRMARRRTAGRKTPGRNGFGSKDRRMSSYKHHRFPGYGRFLIRSGAFSDNRSGLLSGRLRRIPASRVLLPDRPERTPHDAFRSSDRHPETAPPVPPERPGRTPHGSGGRQIVAITLFFGK